MNAQHLLLISGLLLGADPSKADEARKAVDAYLKKNVAQTAKVEMIRVRERSPKSPIWFPGR